ncbi:sodium:solute symporter family protein [Desulfosarcina sp. OttesenSCG-928-G10]|nr:sodium:solute symporter family protein [Desulfosarcina sp. OttesenSCG-928-G10]MDL2322194.1 sodium:solute symporter family protein [Desulfosarcina sp. OttesenSCG-928-B08]
MEIALLGVYAIMIVGLAASGRKRTAVAFFVNERASGPWGVAFSIVVSCVGASATIGMIGMAFTVGTPAFWWLGMGAAGLVALSVLLARKVRRSGAYTMPHMVETVLGKPVRPLVAVVVVIAWSAILAAQFSAVVRVLESLTRFSPLFCLVVGFFLIVAHTFGGQAAIMRTDRLQALILFLALLVMLGWLNGDNASWPSRFAFEATNEQFPPEKLVYFMIVVGANYLVCPMLFGRLLSARDEGSARLGGLLAAAGIMICAMFIVAVGLACRGLLPADTAQDAVLTTVLAQRMPPWMHLVVSFTLLSAIISSADSCLVTASTVLSFDLLGKRSAASGRLCVLVLGLAGAALSLSGKDILGFLLMAYDVYACGVVVPVFAGLMLYGYRRMDTRWACAAVVSGGLCGAMATVSGQTDFSYIGMALSGLLTLAGAFFAQPSVHNGGAGPCKKTHEV